MRASGKRNLKSFAAFCLCVILFLSCFPIGSIAYADWMEDKNGGVVIHHDDGSTEWKATYDASQFDYGVEVDEHNQINPGQSHYFVYTDEHGKSKMFKVPEYNFDNVPSSMQELAKIADKKEFNDYKFNNEYINQSQAAFQLSCLTMFVGNSTLSAGLGLALSAYSDYMLQQDIDMVLAYGSNYMFDDWMLSLYETGQAGAFEFDSSFEYISIAQQAALRTALQAKDDKCTQEYRAEGNKWQVSNGLASYDNLPDSFIKNNPYKYKDGMSIEDVLRETTTPNKPWAGKGAKDFAIFPEELEDYMRETLQKQHEGLYEVAQKQQRYFIVYASSDKYIYDGMHPTTYKLSFEEMSALAAIIYHSIQSNDWRLMLASQNMMLNAGFNVSEADFNKSRQAMMGFSLDMMKDILNNFGLVRTGHAVDPMNLKLIQRYMDLENVSMDLDIQSFKDLVGDEEWEKFRQEVEAAIAANPDIVGTDGFGDYIANWFASRETKSLPFMDLPGSDRLFKGGTSFLTNLALEAVNPGAAQPVTFAFDFWVPKKALQEAGVATVTVSQGKTAITKNTYEFLKGNNFYNPLPIANLLLLGASLDAYNKKLVQHEQNRKAAQDVYDALNAAVDAGYNFSDIPSHVPEMMEADKQRFIQEHMASWEREHPDSYEMFKDKGDDAIFAEMATYYMDDYIKNYADIYGPVHGA